MFLEIGPASLVISGEKNGGPYDFNRLQLEKKTQSILEEIKECLPVLKQKAYKIRNTAYMPHVPRKMVEAVKAVDEASLTPMAAVAGAVSDAIRDHLRGEGLNLVSVNNGGDVSVFNEKGRALKIEIAHIHRDGCSPPMLIVEQLTDFGVATSGFGGRSFTLGLADSVTVIAATGALADAAATFIGNCTNTETEQVKRRKAYEIDPLTDIPDYEVTIQIKPLNNSDIIKALENGLDNAANLRARNTIYDAIIKIQGHMVTTIDGDYPIKMEVPNGN